MSCVPRRQRVFRRRSRSPLRPTGGCRRASRCAKRSSRWMPRRMPAPPTSWSIARIRLISPRRWSRTAHGTDDWFACARTHPRRATPNSTRRPSSMRVIQRISLPGTPHRVTAAGSHCARWLLRHRRAPRGCDLLGIEDQLGSCAMSALDAIADWPVPTTTAVVVGPSGVLAQRRRSSPVQAGVGDQTSGGPRGAHRDRRRRDRVRHRGRTARLHGAASARPCVGTALSSLKRRGWCQQVVDQWFCWFSASG